MLTIFGWNFDIWAAQKYVNIVDLVKSFLTSICLETSASIQPRMSLSKFGGDSIHFFKSLLVHKPTAKHAPPPTDDTPCTVGRSSAPLRSPGGGWRSSPSERVLRKSVYQNMRQCTNTSLKKYKCSDNVLSHHKKSSEKCLFGRKNRL